jgi:hypothetical protein
MAVPFNLSKLAVVGDPVSLVQGIRHPAGGAADFVISANGTLAYCRRARRPKPPTRLSGWIGTAR